MSLRRLCFRNVSFDFDAAVTAPFRMQPGLRRLPEGSRQFTPLAPGCAAQREKLAVLSAFWPEAMVATVQADPGPALAAVCRQSAAEHPQHFQWDGHRALCPPLGVAVQEAEVVDLRPGAFGLGDEIGRCLRGLPEPWRLPGLLSLAFLEDLALIDAPADGSPATVPWMCVALPSHWSPADKVGKPFAALHAPVADNRTLLAAGEALMSLVSAHPGGAGGPGIEHEIAPQVRALHDPALQGGATRRGPALNPLESTAPRWERFVWTVSPHPRRHAHPSRVDPRGWPQGKKTDFGTQAWWRTERQTFIPVQGAGGRAQAVFTIAVECSPLSQALNSTHRARRLYEAISTMSPAVLQYRGMQAVREPLLAWLWARAQTGAPQPAASLEP